MIAFRVLIVDDDADDREFLRGALERAGIEPVLALESASGLFTYLQNVSCDEDLPRLILTDLNMPGATGVELLRKLRTMARYQHIPVIVCSTSSFSPDITTCLTAGARQYLTKPTTFWGYQQLSEEIKPYVVA